ncbi:sodium:solute symporter [Bacteroides propionicifaciens]|uniref:sodium:solute symporter n=1 Tax=Bacteroides propionicifaciens TaxID=392838 RepID=UPI00036A4E97|nr:sodium:solute symporter [Bacteroides propionicifaciens]
MLVIVTIIIYFALLFGISKIVGRGEQSNSNHAFFKAENKSPWFIVAFGMIGATISGVTFVSVPGMPRAIDMTYMQLVIGFFFGYIFVAKLLLPLYYRLGLTSIYTYLEQRIGPKAYKTGSLFFLLSRMLGTAAKLYLVCLILQHFVFNNLDIPLWLIAAVAVALVWVYTHQSGIKTIVWTDALQTACLVLALIAIVFSVMQQLNLSPTEAYQTIRESSHSRIFIFDDWMSKQNFFKQFISGIFIVIVMTGLDQDMMQKNLTCRNLRDAQKNMYSYGFAFIPLNLLFLGLGILLIMLSAKLNIELPTKSDDILPMLATQGYLGEGVTILFTIGIIAAAFSNSDSALTSMTTSVCVDLLKTEEQETKVAIRKRNITHIGLSVLLVICISLVDIMNSPTVIDAIYVIASYTYGPLLGMFAFGLLTKRIANDNTIPYIAIASPILCYLLGIFTSSYWSYTMGYELLMINGLITFLGLYIGSNKSLTKTITL